MQLLSIQDFKILAQFSATSAPCISIYMPTHRSFPDTNQDPIRLKNLLRGAEERLLSAGTEPGKIAELLRPVKELLNIPLFWRHQRDGLAIFITQDLFRCYQVTIPLPELVVVTERFHLKPLLALLSRDRRFFILALSQKQARLFEGSLENATDITPDDFPEDLASVLELYDPQKSLQSHSGSGGAGGRAGIFHGQGSGKDDLKERITEYFRQIDRSVVSRLSQQQSPLVLSAVDSLMPLYRAVNTYPYLADDGIVGNPDLLSAEETHRKAWPIVDKLFQVARSEAADKYAALAGTGRASRDLEEIVAAAHGGRVETLFVAVGVQRWGRFQADQGVVDLREEPRPDDEDLLNLAAVQTLLHAGNVFAVQPSDVPDGQTVTAVFRY